MVQSSNTDGSDKSIKRRTFLKETTAAGAALVAGCTGDDSGNTSDGDASPNGATVGNSSGKKYDGITIEYWNRFHLNTQKASTAIKQAISAFEKDTGATVKVNYATGEPGQKWLTLAKRGRQPHIMDQVSGMVGPFVALDIAKPFTEYKHLFSDALIEHTKWFQDALGEQAYSGFDGNAYEFKFASESTRLFLARRDHLEAAGLSPEDDFPPKNFQDGLQLAQTLQENGPGQHGWQIYGGSGDVTDTCTEDWPVAHGGNGGKVMNKDWSDVQIDNEHFKTTYENFVTIHTEHGLTSGGTLSMSDEAATQLLIKGDASMTQVPSATYADLLSSAKEMVFNGDFIFGPAWKGQSGARGMIGGNGIIFNKPPDGADQAKWDRKQEIAADLLENYLYYTEEFQKTMLSTIGGGPIRDDVTPEDIKGAIADPTGYEQTNLIEATFTGKFDQKDYYIQSAAPMFGQIQGAIMPGYIQQALQGKITASEALEQAAEDARNQFF